MMDYLEAYRGKTILITGGAGAIGSNLTRALGELGAKLVLASVGDRERRGQHDSLRLAAAYRDIIR